MAVEKALERERESSRGWSRSFGLLNPISAVWWLFTSVRFAIALLAALCAASLLGVLLPQTPLPMRGIPAAEAAWLAIQESRFGPLTGPMDWLGLFDLFHTGWFAILIGVTAASTSAYIVSRIPIVWRSITDPRTRVPDSYFETAPQRLEIAGARDLANVEGALRRARYRVERFDEGGATYIFADRFQWAQAASLITHAAVIVLILSAVVSRVDSFSSPLFLSEGATLPVFPVRDSNQMQVELRNVAARFASDGQPLDYHSDLVIYRLGDEVKRCQSTVNSPCGYNGYRFYQSAYFGFGAAVEVRDAASGNVVYRETLALSDSVASPQVTITDGSGRVLLDEVLILTDELTTGELSYRGTLQHLPGDRLMTIGLRTDAESGRERLVVIEAGENQNVVRLSLAEGESVRAAGLTVAFARLASVPSAEIPDFPMAGDGGRLDRGQAFLQLKNVVYGTSTASEGTLDAPEEAGPPTLTLGGLQARAVELTAGESAIVDGLEYTFIGQREFSGITVRRDRSDYLVWIGAALVFIGLIATFWVPRRRLWAKITETRTQLAGQAPTHANYPRELAKLFKETAKTSRG